MRPSLAIIALLALSTGLVSCGSPKRLRTHHLSFVPERMEVQEVLYSEEEAHGWGPSANETGVIVYELPSGIAENIENKGIDYLSTLYGSTGKDRDAWRKAYRQQWNATPIAEDAEEDREWFDIPTDDATNLAPNSAPKLNNYLNRYGFGIPIKPEIEQVIDETISTSGSFYAYSVGGGGVIIVSPSIARVFYLYAS